MRLIWSLQAAGDLEAIVEYISNDSPEAGRRLAAHIFETIANLRKTPLMGRPRREDKSREIVFTPWPYIAVYEVAEDQLIVKAIRHTSRNWAH